MHGGGLVWLAVGFIPHAFRTTTTRLPPHIHSFLLGTGLLLWSPAAGAQAISEFNPVQFSLAASPIRGKCRDGLVECRD